MLVAERHVLQEVASTLEPAAGLGRAAEDQAVDRELESETRCSTIVAEVACQPVAALVGFQRRRRVELRGGRDAKTQERVCSLFLGQRRLELRPRLLPRTLLKRCLPSFECACDLMFRRALRTPRVRLRARR